MALEMINHVINVGVAGDNSTQATFVCDLEEWQDQSVFLLNSTNELFPNLACKTVRANRMGSGSADKMQLVADFVPRLSIEALTVDLPFRWRLEVSGQTVTIPGNLKWDSDGEPFLKRGALPVKRFSTTKIVLYGMRSVFNLGVYESYIDHVNSHSFLGAAKETVYFDSTQCQQRMLMDGTIIYAIELHLIWKPFGWNNMWRDYPAPGKVDKLLNSDGSPIYPLADLNSLLLAP